MMWQFTLALYFILASFTLTPAHTSTITSYTQGILDNTCIKVADEWIPICNRGRGRENQVMGNTCDGGGRQAPTVAGRSHPVGGSPIATRLSIQQGVPSTEEKLDLFLTVKLNTTPHYITVDLVHVIKSKWPQKHG